MPDIRTQIHFGDHQSCLTPKNDLNTVRWYQSVQHFCKTISFDGKRTPSDPKSSTCPLMPGELKNRLQCMFTIQGQVVTL